MIRGGNVAPLGQGGIADKESVVNCVGMFVKCEPGHCRLRDVSGSNECSIMSSGWALLRQPAQRFCQWLGWIRTAKESIHGIAPQPFDPAETSLGGTDMVVGRTFVNAQCGGCVGREHAVLHPGFVGHAFPFDTPCVPSHDVVDPVVEYFVVNRGRSEEHTSELQSRENLVC